MKKGIQVTCSKRHLAEIRDFVNGWLGEREIKGVLANQIVLAVDEACANCIIHHHQCDDRGRIEVSLHQEQDVVFVEIVDSGRPFPLDRYQPRTLHEIIRKRHKGGMGIFLIHSIMDEINIEEEQGQVVYKFAKYLNGHSPSQ